MVSLVVTRESDALAVVAVTHSPGQALDRLLDSVKAATYRPVRVLLADLGSTDGAPERAVQRDGVDLLRLGEAVARAAAVNRAVAELGESAGWIAIADPGVEWGEGAIDTLLDAAARRPRAGALGPTHRLPDGAVRPSAWELPSVVDVVRRRAPVPAARAEGPVGWLSTSCLLLHRAAWESVDGLDARHPEPFDGVDLGDRLARAGWLCVSVPSAIVTVPAESAGTPTGGDRYVTSRLHGPARAAARVALCATRRRP